ncbi:MAG: hypothetical protein ACRC56_05175 [Bosea sp. (in: a-proteobacteria)]
MKAFMLTAVALSVMSTAVLADNRPLYDPQAGSPMDFIVHDQPAKFPNIGECADWAGEKRAQNGAQAFRAPSPFEKALMDRASGETSGR